MSENDQEKKCLGPLGCKEGDTKVSECCAMNGGFHTEPIERPIEKSSMTFVDEDGCGAVFVPQQKPEEEI